MSNKIDSRLKHVWLISFADSRMRHARDRLFRQALEFGFSNERVFIWDENDLTEGFRNAMGEHLIPGSRGFGYWCWKPEVIFRVLKLVPDGDIVFYSDIGNHLNKHGKKRFYEYLNIADTKGYLGFQSRSLLSNELPDLQSHIRTTSQFTKGDILDFFNVRSRVDILTAAQVLSGILFFKKCNETVEFVMKWGALFRNHFCFADDSVSCSPNMPDFIENRHDQALLSVMWLMRRLPTVSSCEVELLRRHLPSQLIAGPEWGGAWFWQNRKFPIHAKRDKGERFSFLKKLFWYLRNGKLFADIRARLRYWSVNLKKEKC